MTVTDPRQDHRERSRLRAALGFVAGAFLRTLRWTCFWGSIALPVLWLSLLVDGLATGAELRALLGLVLVNLLTIVVGHGHTPWVGPRRGR